MYVLMVVGGCMVCVCAGECGYVRTYIHASITPHPKHFIPHSPTHTHYASLPSSPTVAPNQHTHPPPPSLTTTNAHTHTHTQTQVISATLATRSAYFRGMFEIAMLDARLMSVQQPNKRALVLGAEDEDGMGG